MEYKKYRVLRSGNGWIISAIPNVFTVLPNTEEYFELAPHTSSMERMSETWIRTGKQMNNALKKFESSNGITTKSKFATSK